MIEEWGVGTDSSYDSVSKQAAVFNNAGIPWVRYCPFFHNLNKLTSFF